MFKDLEQGKTNYCQRCKAEKRGLNSLALHTCGKTTAETPENEKLSTIKKCCDKDFCEHGYKKDHLEYCPICHQPKPQEVADWIKEFEKEFKTIKIMGSWYFTPKTMEGDLPIKIKSFITKTIAQEKEKQRILDWQEEAEIRKQERERVKEELIEFFEERQKDAIKYPAKMFPPIKNRDEAYNQGYNQALSDIINKIKNNDEGTGRNTQKGGEQEKYTEAFKRWRKTYESKNNKTSHRKKQLNEIVNKICCYNWKDNQKTLRSLR